MGQRFLALSAPRRAHLTLLHCRFSRRFSAANRTSGPGERRLIGGETAGPAGLFCNREPEGLSSRPKIKSPLEVEQCREPFSKCPPRTFFAGQTIPGLGKLVLFRVDRPAALREKIWDRGASIEPRAPFVSILLINNSLAVRGASEVGSRVLEEESLTVGEAQKGEGRSEAGRRAARKVLSAASGVLSFPEPRNRGEARVIRRFTEGSDEMAAKLARDCPSREKRAAGEWGGLEGASSS